RSAANDVLANFLRLSKFSTRVNFFFRFLKALPQKPNIPSAQRKKSQNIITITTGSRSTQLLAFNCSGLGLFPGWPLAHSGQTLGLRSINPRGLFHHRPGSKLVCLLRVLCLPTACK